MIAVKFRRSCTNPVLLLRLTDADDHADVEVVCYEHRVGTGTRSCRDAGNFPEAPFTSAYTGRGACSR